MGDLGTILPSYTSVPSPISGKIKLDLCVERNSHLESFGDGRISDSFKNRLALISSLWKFSLLAWNEAEDAGQGNVWQLHLTQLRLS